MSKRSRPACTWLWFLTSTSHSQQLGLHERYHSGVLLRWRLLRGTVVRCAASDETRCVVAPTWTNQGLAHLGQALSKVTYFGQHAMEVAEVKSLMPNTQSRRLRRSLDASSRLWRSSDAIPGIADSVRSSISDHRAQPPHEASRPQSTIRDEYPDCYTDKGNCCSMFIRRLRRSSTKSLETPSMPLHVLCIGIFVTVNTPNELPPRAGDGERDAVPTPTSPLASALMVICSSQPSSSH